MLEKKDNQQQKKFFGKLQLGLLKVKSLFSKKLTIIILAIYILIGILIIGLGIISVIYTVFGGERNLLHLNFDKYSGEYTIIGLGLALFAIGLTYPTEKQENSDT